MNNNHNSHTSSSNYNNYQGIIIMRCAPPIRIILNTE